RRRKERHIGDRYAEEFERRVFKIDHFFVVLVDDALGAHAPQWRLIRIVLAGLASRVGALVENGGIAFDAFGARRAEICLVGASDRPRRIRIGRSPGESSAEHVLIWFWGR